MRDRGLPSSLCTAQTCRAVAFQDACVLSVKVFTGFEIVEGSVNGLLAFVRHLSCIPILLIFLHRRPFKMSGKGARQAPATSPSPVKLAAVLAAAVALQVLLGQLITAKWVAIAGGGVGGVIALCLSLLLVQVLGRSEINWTVALASVAASAFGSAAVLHPVAGTVCVMTSAVLFTALSGYSAG